MNIKAASATHIEKSLSICYCQVDKLNCSDICNINHVSKNIVSSWQKIIHRDNQLIKADTNINIDYNYYKSNSLGHPNSLMGILEPIIRKIEMLEEHLTKIESSCFSNNPQSIILCDIIQV